MKARYEAKCGRCGVLVHIGDSVSTKYGYWHTSCVISYDTIRRAIAASAAQE